MKLRSTIMMLIAAFSFNSCSSQKAGKKGLADFIQGAIDSLQKKEQLPGILVAISNNGQNDYYTSGYAQPDTKIKFDSSTIFEAGSITKTFTAYVVESVLRDHKLNDSISILSFLPADVQQNKLLANITFLSLLNHTSGLPKLPDNMKIDFSDKQPYQNYNSEMLFKYLQTAVPATDKRSAYSNLGMALCGVLAETISGKSYASLLDEYIFLPFKIVKPDKAITLSPENKSQGYLSNSEKAEYWNFDVMAPAGGLKCSAKEMLIYLGEMSQPSSDRSEKVIDHLLQPTVSLNKKVNVGRGWHMLQEDKMIYWHNGGTYGFSTFAAFIKGTGQSVIVVANRFGSNAAVDALGVRIMKKLIE